jgi:hypothetical protein
LVQELIGKNKMLFVRVEVASAPAEEPFAFVEEACASIETAAGCPEDLVAVQQP